MKQIVIRLSDEHTLTQECVNFINRIFMATAITNEVMAKYEDYDKRNININGIYGLCKVEVENLNTDGLDSYGIQQLHAFKFQVSYLNDVLFTITQETFNSI